MFSSTNRSLPGVRLGGEQGEVVLAEDLRAHEAEQEAELAGRHPAVGEGHRRLGEAAAGRHDLVEQLRLELADQLGEGRDVRVDPAGPVDDGRPLDDARQLGPERRPTAAGRSAPSRRRTTARSPAARRASGVPGAARSRPIATRSAPRPVDEALARHLLGPPAEDGRRRAERRADEEPRLPDAVVAPGRPGRGGPVRRGGLRFVPERRVSCVMTDIVACPGVSWRPRPLAAPAGRLIGRRPRPRSTRPRGTPRRRSAPRPSGRRRRRRSSAGDGSPVPAPRSSRRTRDRRRCRAPRAR